MVQFFFFPLQQQTFLRCVGIWHFGSHYKRVHDVFDVRKRPFWRMFVCTCRSRASALLQTPFIRRLFLMQKSINRSSGGISAINDCNVCKNSRCMVFDLDNRFDAETILMKCKNHTSRTEKRTTIELNIYFEQTAKVQRTKNEHRRFECENYSNEHLSIALSLSHARLRLM